MIESTSSLPKQPIVGEFMIDNINPENIPDQTVDVNLSILTRAKRVGQGAILFAEFSPLNEATRLAAFGAAHAASGGDPFIGGATLGLATFVIEAGAGLASASLFETKTSSRLFEGINSRAKKLGIPSEKRLPTATKVGFTFMGGTVVGMALEQRENPTRTVAENRRYSLITSSWQGGILAVAGYMMSEGINVGIDDPKRGLLIAAVLATGTAAGLKIKKIINKRTKKEN
jgi:hypothetical protein